jgi:hypothetical protein
LDDLRFDSASRLAFVEQGSGVALISGMILGWQDDGSASQAVAQSVQSRALFTAFGTGTGGMLGISAIYGGTIRGAVVAVGDCRFCNRTHDFGITRGCGARRAEVGKWLKGHGRKRGGGGHPGPYVR